MLRLLPLGSLFQAARGRSISLTLLSVQTKRGRFISSSLRELKPPAATYLRLLTPFSKPASVVACSAWPKTLSASFLKFLPIYRISPRPARFTLVFTPAAGGPGLQLTKVPVLPACRRCPQPNHHHSDPSPRVFDSTSPAVSIRGSGATRT